MRLGDTSNISHGRTSASTLDDALSGRADVASSATSDSGDVSEETDQSVPLVASARSTNGQYGKTNGDLPRYNTLDRSKGENDGDYLYEDKNDGLFKSDMDDVVNESGQTGKPKHIRSKIAHRALQKSRSTSVPKKSFKHSRHLLDTSHKKSKVPSVPPGMKLPLSPVSVATQPRKNSSASTLNFQHHLGADEEDLSSKPRCQRCRKSKKGCDRQRPCQRCKDAGIGIEGCISEDEGNGRKGRFGRHMGVSVKKETAAGIESDTATGILSTGLATNLEKNKKRKR